MKKRCREGKSISEWEKGKKEFLKKRGIGIEVLEEKAREGGEWFSEMEGIKRDKGEIDERK